MIKQSFEKLIQLMNENLYGKKVGRVFNSIGSNIFIEVGYDIKIPKENECRKEWIFWISWSSWRITKNDLYVVGSGDLRDDIHLGIDYLMNKNVKNVCFTSSYLDLQIEFDDGYILNTFFSKIEEDQWTIFMPDGDDFTIDFSVLENIKEIQSFSNEFIVKKQVCNTVFCENSLIRNLYFEKERKLLISLENKHKICFSFNIWRIESNDDYIIGYRDENFYVIVNLLEDKNLKEIRIENEFMDSKITFDKGYSIQTFACCREEHQWSIKNRNPSFNANIKLSNLFNM